MLKKSIIRNLENIVGDTNTVIEPDELNSFLVDGIAPQCVVCPDTVEQTAELMKLASKEALSVIPRGSGTKLLLGNKPESADIVLSTRRLNRVIEHAASDMVATTECGISIKDFQAELNNKNQFLALDPSHQNQNATVGGVIATNDSGPQRLRYGSAREFLIGLKVVKADGSVFKGGSKVVKNVAGYDLPKLYVGSLGTLGIIVEATFRLYPVPEHSETFAVSFSDIEECSQTVQELLNSNLVINALEILNPSLSEIISKRIDLDIQSNGLLINIKNVEKAVKDQISKISEAVGGAGIIITGEKEEKLWEEVRDYPINLIDSGRVVCKSSTLVSQSPELFHGIENISRRNGVEIYISARAGSGIFVISFDGNSEKVKNTLYDLRALVAEQGGSLILQEAPAHIKEGFDVWGNIGSGLGIMRRIKQNFDPFNILNPGRFI